MALGRRGGERQEEFWAEVGSLARGPGHVFYDKLNRLLAEAGFDAFVEELCASHYKSGGRGSVPPGNYFRILFVGCLEGIDSQRGIAWRCRDSLSLRRFLDVPLNEQTPDHSSLTRIRERLPLEIHQRVFQFILEIVQSHALIKASSVGVDSTTLEANAAMKAIVRKDSGEDWNAYLTRLMREEGLIKKDEQPSDDELRRFDRRRGKRGGKQGKGGKKKVSNEQWHSPVDLEARIIKMKDGRTRLGYKAEHVIDLESEFILSAQVYHGIEADTATLLASVGAAQANLVESGNEQAIQEVVADAGYHKSETIFEARQAGLRTYIPEPKLPFPKRWTDKPDGYQRVVHNNRRRNKRSKGRSHQRKRSERVERSFAHVCETGGARRSWLRGLEKINKRYLVHTAARNLGLLMLQRFGIGKPRTLQDEMAAWKVILESFRGLISPPGTLWTRRWLPIARLIAFVRVNRKSAALAA